jgi:hypothetical protein
MQDTCPNSKCLAYKSALLLLLWMQDIYLCIYVCACICTSLPLCMCLARISSFPVSDGNTKASFFLLASLSFFSMLDCNAKASLFRNPKTGNLVLEAVSFFEEVYVTLLSHTHAQMSPCPCNWVNSFISLKLCLSLKKSILHFSRARARTNVFEFVFH